MDKEKEKVGLNCNTINTMTAAHDFSLCQCELASIEWKIARQLQDVLKVRIFLLL